MNIFYHVEFQSMMVITTSKLDNNLQHNVIKILEKYSFFYASKQLIFKQGKYIYVLVYNIILTDFSPCTICLGFFNPHKPIHLQSDGHLKRNHNRPIARL